jgi:predicted chitinase
MSAAWFWDCRGRSALADHYTEDSDLEDFAEIARRINGATVGLNDRLAVLNQIATLLA